MSISKKLASRAATAYEWTMFTILSVVGVLGLSTAVRSLGSASPIDVISTTLLSLLALSLGLERVLLILRVIRAADDARVDVEGKLASIVSTIQEHGQHLRKVEEKLEKLEVNSHISVLTEYEKHLSPYFARVFSSLWEDKVRRLREAIAQGEVILDSRQDFKHFYLRTLEHFRGHPVEFVATSLPYKKYFWDGETLQAVADFVTSDGPRMRRIFIVREAEQQQDEVQLILRAQQESKINVLIASRESIHQDLTKRFIMVETTRRIAWEVFVRDDDDSEIREVRVTTNPNRIEKLWGEVDGISARPFVAH